MPRANLTLTLPEDVWIGDVSRTYPDAQFRILSAFPAENGGVGLAEVSADSLRAVLTEIQNHESIAELYVLQRHQDTALIQFETPMPLLLLPIQGSGIPLEMPFTIRDGEAEWEITAPQDRLSELGTQLEEFGISFTVNDVSQHIEPTRLLTAKQLQLVREAVDRGYYDTPRCCSLTELADELGIAKSTCSETLHRAEEKIIKEFMEGAADSVPDSTFA
ncbi:helix-turn-helix domain-containing protein [Natribaculum luteum]|uniref:Helix-turn-helix domain-containing protein n=1 Tax=Natribaculum luteum TaxID=1586232 RepID=A0ABD5P1H5_9EURY|nr:helix-turn-helix domain-containing protein [Natribaculum luteum]